MFPWCLCAPPYTEPVSLQMIANSTLRTQREHRQGSAGFRATLHDELTRGRL